MNAENGLRAATAGIYVAAASIVLFSMVLAYAYS
ncbi:MAG: hypothetical protein K0R53_1803 [Burkholderiales bacterium]|jgi:hypothetical protein|nr:hypothetical protein [Burkholderiales bacterium]